MDSDLTIALPQCAPIDATQKHGARTDPIIFAICKQKLKGFNQPFVQKWIRNADSYVSQEPVKMNYVQKKAATAALKEMKRTKSASSHYEGIFQAVEKVNKFPA